MRPAFRNFIVADNIPAPALSWNFLQNTLTPLIGQQSLTFTRASTATSFDISGVRQTTSAGQVRFEYDRNTHAPRGLLIEGQRTNSFLNSAAPATQTITVAVGSYSLWIEGTGSITAAFGTAVGTLSPANGISSSGTPVVITVTTAGTVTATVSGSPTLAQFENGADASSYIPTAGAAATRNSDVLSGVLEGWYNPNECTVVVEADGNGVPYRSDPLVEIGDGTNNNRFTITHGTAGYLDNSIRSGGVAYGVPGIGAGWNNGVIARAALSLKSGMAHLVFQLPSTAVSAGSVVMPVGCNKINLGSGQSGILSGCLRKVDIYNRKLTPSQMVSLLRFK